MQIGTMPECHTTPAAPRLHWSDAMCRTRDKPDAVFKVYEVAPLIAATEDLLDGARALVAAYDAGAEAGGSVEWEDLDTAHRMLRAALTLSGDTEAVVRTVQDWSPSACYYVRYTRGGGVHAVGIVDHPNGGTRVYYGRATGYGYDKVAAALSGMPLPGRHGWYLTDHSAIPSGAGWRDRYDFERNAVMVHRGGYLPSHLVIK